MLANNKNAGSRRGHQTNEFHHARELLLSRQPRGPETRQNARLTIITPGLRRALRSDFSRLAWGWIAAASDQPRGPGQMVMRVATMMTAVMNVTMAVMIVMALVMAMIDLVCRSCVRRASSCT